MYLLTSLTFLTKQKTTNHKLFVPFYLHALLYFYVCSKYCVVWSSKCYFPCHIIVKTHIAQHCLQKMCYMQHKVTKKKVPQSLEGKDLLSFSPLGLIQNLYIHSFRAATSIKFSTMTVIGEAFYQFKGFISSQVIFSGAPEGVRPARPRS